MKGKYPGPPGYNLSLIWHQYDFFLKNFYKYYNFFLN